MTDFLRPEVRAFFWRWREVLLATGLAVLGVWWGATGVGITRWLGFLCIAIGAAWGFAGVQRVRFAQGADGPGVVQIRERRLAYFGPLDGGVMDVEDVISLALDPSGYPAPHWVITGAGGQRLAIPVNAAGSDDLFDVFASLPGINTHKMLDVLSRTPDAHVIIWARTRPVLH
ncbi:hypothetical protein [Yoonia sp. SS1-5]|uniref:Uncharacterized protein n=1 Tax=Yoonia rhodophyticola TaxID=3137370 RepID=A0AAN0MCF9_9RHOB